MDRSKSDGRIMGAFGSIREDMVFVGLVEKKRWSDHDHNPSIILRGRTGK
jgi:hypothetical protein